MDALERLVATQEIGDLISRYAITFDDQNWDEFGTLWTEDAAFVVEETSWEGKEALLAFLSTCLPAGYVSKHMVSRPLIEVADDGQTARARTDVVWVAANFENTIVGRYVDDLVRQDGRWLFRRREEIPVPFAPGAPPMSDAAVDASSPTMRA